jgi:membrane fusion protein (multidrug efflux system)
LLKRPSGDQYTVEIVMADGSLFPETGHITFADPAYNSQTGTFTVRVQLANPQGRLRPNQFVRALVRGAVRPRALAVPQRAVQQGPKGHFVWVVDKDSKVEMRPVGMGSWIGEDWQITEGLEPNSVVVVDGALSLTSGVTVKARPLPPTAPERNVDSATPTADAKSPPPDARRALPASVYFARGSAALSSNAKEALRAIGNGLIGVPYTVEITGYADATGSAAKNRALAAQRAKVVRDALMAAGVKADLLRVATRADSVGGADAEMARRVDIAFEAR